MGHARGVGWRGVTDGPPDVSWPLLVAAYRAGYFPMGMDDGEIGWFSPDPRAILPLDTFHVPRRLGRLIRSKAFSVTTDTAFRRVMDACAAQRGEGTWITAEILEVYGQLFDRGLAHSVEVWRDGALAGGLYGVSLGGAFFGESMFHRVTGASKVALVGLVERLRSRGYVLLDTQWTTPLLETFGAVEIPRDLYLARLEQAIPLDCRFGDR
ncbi:MAG: leucyl/phenylalanyl-tRNA--protein transferase [Vicinamibacterales bacterium]|nr:leucyl/phenylalanyl-tRNA--protein transferase [Vicinamibacterales bacterium]